MAEAKLVGSVPFSQQKAHPFVRVLATGLAGLFCLLALWGMLSRPDLALSGVVPEQFPRLELVQVGVWVAICAVATLACATNRHHRSILIAFWFSVLSALAVFRELDLHTLLNPQNIQMLGIDPEHGVRFRFDWWTSAETSLVLRAIWAGVFVTLASLLILPFAMARYPWFSQAIKGAPFALLVGFGFAALAAGYVLDDFFGRQLSRSGFDISIFEEIAEIIGPALIFAAIVLLALRRVRLFPNNEEA